jgi:hypothetical protein
MLGQSESISVFQEQFQPLSKTGKIYESVFAGKRAPLARNTLNLGNTGDMKQQNVLPSATIKSTSKLKPEKIYSEIIINKLKKISSQHHFN